MSRIITLTTDFGLGSIYVAQMKGRLLREGLQQVIIDISHDLPAHDIRAAAWLIAQVCPCFPEGTLHLVVIDPGVGTQRKMVWVRIGTQEYLAPDNGLLTQVMLLDELRQPARVLPVPAGASATFHGRDVVAVAACRLLRGEPPESLGPEHGPLLQLPAEDPISSDDGLRGSVRFIDHFGNLITNLKADCWPQIEAAGGLLLDERPIDHPVRTYGDAPPGTAVVLVGSQGFVEIAVVQGSAARLLCGEIGMPVRVRGG